MPLVVERRLVRRRVRRRLRLGHHHRPRARRARPRLHSGPRRTNVATMATSPSALLSMRAPLTASRREERARAPRANVAHAHLGAAMRALTTRPRPAATTRTVSEGPITGAAAKLGDGWARRALVGVYRRQRKCPNRRFREIAGRDARAALDADSSAVVTMSLRVSARCSHRFGDRRQRPGRIPRLLAGTIDGSIVYDSVSAAGASGCHETASYMDWGPGRR